MIQLKLRFYCLLFIIFEYLLNYIVFCYKNDGILSEKLNNLHSHSNKYHKKDVRNIGYNGPNHHRLELIDDPTVTNNHFKNSKCSIEQQQKISNECYHLKLKLLDPMFNVRENYYMDPCERSKFICFNDEIWHEIANCTCNICENSIWFWDELIHHEIGLYWDELHCNGNYPLYMNKMDFCTFMKQPQLKYTPIHCLPEGKTKQHQFNQAKLNKHKRFENRAKAYSEKYNIEFNTILKQLYDGDKKNHNGFQIDFSTLDIWDESSDSSTQSSSDSSSHGLHKENIKVIQNGNHKKNKNSKRNLLMEQQQDESSQLPQSYTSQAIYIAGTVFIGFSLIFSCYFLVGR